MRPLIPLALATLLVTGASSAATPATPDKGEAHLQHFLKGRTPGKPIDCIQPDLSAQPVIYDGAGIVYFTAGKTYVARMAGECPALRENRTIFVRGAGGRLCRNDPVRIRESSGADFGFCTIAGFTPYSK